MDPIRWGLGTVRVDEAIMPIVALRLVLGGVEVTAAAWGPLPESTGHVRVFTADGQAVTEWAAGETTVVEVPALLAGDHVHITYTLHFHRIVPETEPCS